MILNSPRKSDLKIFADLAKKLNISVRYAENPEIEEVEDWKLLAEMQESMESGLADTNSVLKKLGIKTNAN
jgi:hypothetical protein